MTDTVYSRWEQERKERKEARRLAVNELFTAKAIHLVTGEFDGSGDSGDLHSLNAFTASNEEVTLTKDEWYVVEEALHALLPGGWEINDGSSGNVWIKADGTCGGEIGWNVIQVEYETIGDGSAPSNAEKE